MDHEVFVDSNRKKCNFFKSENYKSNILISNPGKFVETIFFFKIIAKLFYLLKVFGVSLMHRWQYFTLFHFAECFGFFKTNQNFCVTSLCKSDSFGFTTRRVYFVNINYTIVWFYILDIIFFPIFCHVELFYILTNIFKIKYFDLGTSNIEAEFRCVQSCKWDQKHWSCDLHTTSCYVRAQLCT